jgi:hypothetical protein
MINFLDHESYYCSALGVQMKDLLIDSKVISIFNDNLATQSMIVSIWQK